MHRPKKTYNSFFSSSSKVTVKNLTTNKWKFEIKTMLFINKSINSLVAKKSFPIPSRKVKAQLYDSSHSSLASAKADEKKVYNSPTTKIYNRALVTQHLANGNIKIKNLLSDFIKVEEELAPFISKQKAIDFNLSLSGILSRCLSAYSLFDKFNIRQLTLAILFIACKKAKVSESLFFIILRRVTKYRIFNNHQISSTIWFKEIHRYTGNEEKSAGK